MAVQVKRRRGNTAAHAAFTGAQGELTVNTDTWRVHSHDGTTLGGHPLALLADTATKCTDTSTAANSIIVASNTGPVAPVDGMLLLIVAAQTSTGSVTIDYNGVTSALVSGTGAVLTPGAVQAGALILVMYLAASSKYLLLANHGGMPQFAEPLPVSQGGTGANTVAGILAVLGMTDAIVLAGTWDANANNPAFTSGTAVPGHGYRVGTAGTTTLDGISQWNVGDWAVGDINGVWRKFDGIASEVFSVAGRTGDVTLSVSDVSGAASSSDPVFNSDEITPTDGATLPIPAGISKLFVMGTTQLNSLTLELPATPTPGRGITIIFQPGVSSFTLTAPTGYSINSAVSGVAIYAGGRVRTDLNGTLWM